MYKSIGLLLLSLILSPQLVEDFSLSLVVTRRDIPEEEPHVGWGSVEMDSTTHQPFRWRTVLELTLVKLDQDSYSLGDEVTFEVLLRNVSQEPVTIPWSPDWRKAYFGAEKATSAPDGPPPGYVSAQLTLVIGDESAEPMLAQGTALYGSNLSPETLLRLQPGQTARISAPGRWTFSRRTADRLAEEGLPGTFGVRSRFEFFYTNLSNQKPYHSVNRLQVELKPEG